MYCVMLSVARKGSQTTPGNSQLSLTNIVLQPRPGNTLLYKPGKGHPALPAHVHPLGNCTSLSIECFEAKSAKWISVVTWKSEELLCRLLPVCQLFFCSSD